MSNFRQNAKHEYIGFRLQPSEKTAVEQAARLHNRSLSEQLRLMIVNSLSITTGQAVPDFGQKNAVTRAM